MSDQKLIGQLNRQLNREVTTCLRYLLQAASIRGAEHEKIRELYANEVPDELGHAQYLATQIVDLGGTPSLEPDLATPPDDVRVMLERDSVEEEQDVENYRQLATLAEDEGHFALKVRMEEHASDEGEHGRKLRRLLG